MKGKETQGKGQLAHGGAAGAGGLDLPESLIRSLAEEPSHGHSLWCYYLSEKLEFSAPWHPT